MLLSLVLCMALSQAADGAAPAAQGDAKPAETAPATPPAARKPRPKADERWTLDYQPGPLRLYRDPASGKSYWYGTFTLVNRTGADRNVAPRWDLLDEQGHLMPEGKDVPGDVSRAIQRLLNDPSIEESSALIGTLPQGASNARAGFVVFPAVGDDRRFSILVSGLSSERDELKDPKSGKPVTVRKALRMDYGIPGDRAGLQGAVPLVDPAPGEANPSWIFR
jgi:hypothetical protein